MRFRAYKPGWADIDTPPDSEVADTKELLNLEWVKKARNSPKFLGYTQSKQELYFKDPIEVEYIISAVLDNESWVIGFTDEKPDLPE